MADKSGAQPLISGQTEPEGSSEVGSQRADSNGNMDELSQKTFSLLFTKTPQFKANRQKVIPNGCQGTPLTCSILYESHDAV